jgi:site-specific recombinase XerD
MSDSQSLMGEDRNQSVKGSSPFGGANPIFVTITDDQIAKFRLFCQIDKQLAKKTIKEHVNCIKRYAVQMNFTISHEQIRKFLLEIKAKHYSPRTYRLYLCAFKVFCRDFLKREEWVKDLKFATITQTIITDLPEREQLKRFFDKLPNDTAKAMFLIYASSGLRKSEILNVKIVEEQRALVPTVHEQFSTKNSYISFYNHEAEAYLMKLNYALSLSEISIRRWFQKASKESGVHLTPQMLREWFCSEMGELNVPDRYVDAFCGRIPKTVLGKRYTNYSIKKLKKIYDNANLTIFEAATPKQADPEPRAKQPEIIEIKTNDMEAIKRALLNGYKHADTVGDIRLYMKT